MRERERNDAGSGRRVNKLHDKILPMNTSHSTLFAFHLAGNSEILKGKKKGWWNLILILFSSSTSSFDLTNWIQRWKIYIISSQQILEYYFWKNKNVNCVWSGETRREFIEFRTLTSTNFHCVWVCVCAWNKKQTHNSKQERREKSLSMQGIWNNFPSILHVVVVEFFLPYTFSFHFSLLKYINFLCVHYCSVNRTVNFIESK